MEITKEFIDGLKLEYLTAVFYLPQSLPTEARGRLFHSLIVALLDAVKLPRFDVVVFADTTTPTPDRRWNRRKGNFPGIEESGVSRKDTKRLDVLLDLPNDVGEMLCSAPRRGAKARTIDFWWNLSCSNSTVSNNKQLDPRIVFNINTSFFRNAADTSARHIVDVLIGAINHASSCYYGHIEVARESETIAGLYYSSMIPTPQPWHRLVNHAVWWNQAIDRHAHVRDVYWGNYLGPDLAKRYDADGKAVERFMAYRTYPHVANDQYVTKFDNGTLFLALTKNPMDMSLREHDEPFEDRVETAAWLHREFRERGMLA